MNKTFEEISLNCTDERLSGALTELQQVIKEAGDFMARSGTGIPELQADFHCRYHAHFKVEIWEGEAQDFCAIFEFPVVDGVDQPSRSAVIQSIEAVNISEAISSDVENSMFVSIPQFIQHPERCINIAVVKRLQSLNDCGRCAVNAIDLQLPLAWVVPLIPDNGEACRARGIGNEITDDLIKRRSYLTNDFTSEDAITDNQFRRHTVLENMFSGLRVVMLNNTTAAIELRPIGGCKLSPQLFEMLFSPVKLSESTFHCVIRHNGPDNLYLQHEEQREKANAKDTERL